MSSTSRLWPLLLASQFACAAAGPYGADDYVDCNNGPVAGCPCESGGCLAGASCLVAMCVEDASVAEGDVCDDSVQCIEPNICAPNLFVCARACSGYYTENICQDDDYCRPLLGPDAVLVGACVHSDQCADDSGCNGGDACVPVTPSATACVAGCEISWNGVTYTDNCGHTPTEPKYCTPIGQIGEQRLVCLDTTIPAQGESNPCDPVANPCEHGAACINGLCKRHCDTENAVQCSGGDICCAVVQGGEVYGICDSSC